MENIILPVITLYQPWATWIVRGWKTIETRTHNRFSCLLHNRVLIHAGLTTDNSVLVTENPYLTHEQLIQKPEEIVNGYILGSVHVNYYGALNDMNSKASLIDCGTTRRYGLFLDNVQKFDNPIPEKGSMGIWYYDLTNKRKVKKWEAQESLLFS